MIRQRTFVAMAVIAALGTGCSSTPEVVPELETARTAIQQLQQDPGADRYATAEVRKAQAALEQADQAVAEGEDIEVIRHEAYMAQGYADIASARIDELSAREGVEKAELERTQVLEQVRAKEAQLANSRVQELEQELEELKAEKTDRGLVMTLGDVLFDTGQAQLKPGASSTIQQLAGFLGDHPDRRLLIEGHTDSRGSEDFNQDLSQRRADAVRMALVHAGVSDDRVRAQGLGEQFPVASNETSAGRQENRRVDIIVSNAGETGFPNSIEDSRNTAAGFE